MPKGRFSKIPSALLLIFSLFIIYSTSLPFNIRGLQNFQNRITEINWMPFMALDGSRAPISDCIQNIFLFMPIGFFGWISTRRFNLRINNWLIVLFYGAFLSFSVEFFQLFTTDRTTSVTDLITNITGTFFGMTLAFLIRNSWKKVSNQEMITQISHYPLFTPLIFLACIICAYLLLPFDFALDYSLFKLKLRRIFDSPLHFTFSGKNEPFTILFFSILTFLCLKISSHLKAKSSALITLSGLFLFSVFLESLQLIIKSRVPELTDIIVEAIGIVAGFLFFLFCQKGFSGSHLILKSSFFLAFFSNQFYPYKFSWSFQKIIWHPFFSSNSHSTMANLSNTIETSIIYSFAGYLYHHLYRNFSTKSSSMIVVLVMITVIEVLQGWVAGRNPDMTDITVAFLVFLFGRFVCENEKMIFADADKPLLQISQN